MNVNKIISWLLLLVAAFSVYEFISSNSDNGALKKQIAVNEEIIATLRGQIDSTNTVLSDALIHNEALQKEKDDVIALRKHDQEVAKIEHEKLNGQILILETELEPVIAANPKLQELLASYQAREAANATQISTLEDERDAWKAKFEISEESCRAIMKAKLDTEKALQDSIKAFQACNRQLLGASKMISHQRTNIKILSALSLVELGVIAGVVIAGVI